MALPLAIEESRGEKVKLSLFNCFSNFSDGAVLIA